MHFVGGHPMAGSEQEGLAGADADLFVGATWVLTPTGRTDPAGLRVGAGDRRVARRRGHRGRARAARLAGRGREPRAAARGVDAHERRQRAGDEHSILLRLAAGGFRDMTRIASSHPAIWPDICLANRDAIVTALDGYLDELDASPRDRRRR